MDDVTHHDRAGREGRENMELFIEQVCMRTRIGSGYRQRDGATIAAPAYRAGWLISCVKLEYELGYKYSHQYSNTDAQ